MRRFRAAACWIGFVCVWSSTARAGDVAAARFRQPVALAFIDEARLLLVGNRQSGTISVIDTDRQAVVGEAPAVERLSDLVSLPAEGGWLLAADEARHELCLLQREGERFSHRARVDVPSAPVSLCLADGGTRCFVASLWSRRLTVVRVDRGHSPPRLVPERSLALPFAPRLQVWLSGPRRLIVADASGGGLAVIDPAAGAVDSVRVIPGHNIRGLALDAEGERLFVAHQTLSRNARTSFEDVHWGVLMTNVLHDLAVEAVLDPQSDLMRGSRTHRLGDVGRAAGDPAGIALAAGGRTLVAYSGVGEVGILEEGKPGQQRVAAGIRPVAVAVHPGQPTRAYAADALGDAVFALDLSRGEPDAAAERIALGPQPELSPAERGERLFYSARLSHDGWMSCHSCHTDGHTNHLLNDNLSDGSFAAPKRVLSLLGVSETAPYAWNGGMASLEIQIGRSIRTTMRGGEPRDGDVSDLAAYLRTLAPAPPVRQAPDADEKTSAVRGRTVFERLDCARCHAPPDYTSPATFDVGLEDEAGESQFNPPSLRGVSQRDALFHDGRARSLWDVFTTHRHQTPETLSAADLADLLAFLEGL